MEQSSKSKKRLIYSLVTAFSFMGVFTFLTVKNLHDKTIESNALLISNVIIGQSKVIRNVYLREIVGKLRNDGTGGHVQSGNKKGFVPISAQFQRMLSDEAKFILKDIQYKPVSKWNIGPYNINNDAFYQWGWAQLELQNETIVDDPINWQPVYRIENTPDGKVFRYMDAVPATANGCVACHQKFENTSAIKKLREKNGVEYHNFKLNHLIGAFSIDVPLSSIHELTDIHLNKFIMLISVIMISSFIVVFWFSTHSLKQLENLSILSRQSNRDELTGLINRRGFNSSLEQHMQSLRESNTIFSLCVFDLDGFKIINDTYGHQAGDEMLREIARVLHKSFRDNDVLVRLGGDEFAIILSGCNLNKADELCKKLLSNIFEINLDWDGSKIKIAASIGIYECSDSKLNLADVFKEADTACYAAKAQGKNQISKSL